jgi:hypothetical protein
VAKVAWLRAEHRDLNKEVMMKYPEVNREIIDGEDGSLFSQLKRDSKQWSTEKNTDDDKMMKVYDEVWHIVQTSAPVQ